MIIKCNTASKTFKFVYLHLDNLTKYISFFKPFGLLGWSKCNTASKTFRFVYLHLDILTSYITFLTVQFTRAFTTNIIIFSNSSLHTL